MVKKLIAKKRPYIRRTALEPKDQMGLFPEETDFNPLQAEEDMGVKAEIDEILGEDGNVREALAFAGGKAGAMFHIYEGGDSIDLTDGDDYEDVKLLEEWLEENADFRGEENFAENLANRLGLDEEEVTVNGVSEYLESIKGDNSYNWAHMLTPVNWNLYQIPETGEYVTELKVNHGGDPRGNYGPEFYFFEDSEEASSQRFIDLISGYVTVNIEFDNGDLIQYDSESDSDALYFQLSENTVVTTPAAEAFMEYFESLEDMDRQEKLLEIAGL